VILMAAFTERVVPPDKRAERRGISLKITFVDGA